MCSEIRHFSHECPAGKALINSRRAKVSPRGGLCLPDRQFPSARSVKYVKECFDKWYAENLPVANINFVGGCVPGSLLMSAYVEELENKEYDEDVTDEEEEDDESFIKFTGLEVQHFFTEDLSFWNFILVFLSIFSEIGHERKEKTESLPLHAVFMLEPP